MGWKIRQMNNRNYILGYPILLTVLLILILFSLVVGNYKEITPKDVFLVLFSYISKNETSVPKTIQLIVFNIRIPRTLSALIIGSALAVAGCCYQEVFRNDLASPDILGVSSGACVGAALGIIMGVNAIAIQTLSFVVGLLTVLLVYFLTYIIKGNTTLSLVVSGMLISGLMNSILGFIKYTANPETELPSIVYWTMGDISSIKDIQLKIVGIPIIICMLVLFLLRWRLNYFGLSDSEAISMGINIKILRIIVIILSTILVGCAVSVAGTISWIGLVIPHLIKTVFGKNTMYSYPFSLISGAAFLLAIDIVGRIISTSELPLSILTGIFGIVVFLLCLFIGRVGNGAFKNR